MPKIVDIWCFSSGTESVKMFSMDSIGSLGMLDWSNKNTHAPGISVFFYRFRKKKCGADKKCGAENVVLEKCGAEKCGANLLLVLGIGCRFLCWCM